MLPGAAPPVAMRRLLMRSLALQAALLGRDLRRHGIEFAVPPGGVRAAALATEARDDSPRTLPCTRQPNGRVLCGSTEY